MMILPVTNAWTVASRCVEGHAEYNGWTTRNAEEAGQQIAEVVVAIVGPPSRPYHGLSFPAISTKIGTNGTGIGGPENLS